MLPIQADPFLRTGQVDETVSYDRGFFGRHFDYFTAGDGTPDPARSSVDADHTSAFRVSNGRREFDLYRVVVDGDRRNAQAKWAVMLR